MWNAGRCVYMNLRLARELLNAPVPDDWLNAIRPADFEPRYLAIAREHLFDSTEAAENNLPSWPRLVEFWAANNLLQKAKLFWRRLFLSRQVMSVKYRVSPCSPKVLLYYPVRLKDLLKRDAYISWQLLRGDRHLRECAGRQDQVNTLKSWLFSG
jgi:hypothetical protein